MSFFISDAVAATGAPAQGSPMSLILMLVVFGLIFYFMILRPQQKRTKQAFMRYIYFFPPFNFSESNHSF